MKWISIEDRLPNDFDDVFMLENGIEEWGVYDGLNNEFYEGDKFHLRSEVTHWMPSPKPTEDE